MNDAKVKSFVVEINEDVASDFDCVLTDGRTIKIEMADFYDFAIKTDNQLELHSLMFGEWEDLTEELTELEYDFVSKLTEYIQRWSEKDLNQFASQLEEDDFDFDDED